MKALPEATLPCECRETDDIFAPSLSLRVRNESHARLNREHPRGKKRTRGVDLQLVRPRRHIREFERPVLFHEGLLHLQAPKEAERNSHLFRERREAPSARIHTDAAQTQLVRACDDVVPSILPSAICPVNGNFLSDTTSVPL